MCATRRCEPGRRPLTSERTGRRPASDPAVTCGQETHGRGGASARVLRARDVRGPRRRATSPTTSSATPRERADRVVFGRATTGDDGWADVTARQFLDEVRGGRQGPGRRRRRAGRPGRPDLPHPLRVDAARLRDLVRRRGHASRSTRPRRPSRSTGSSSDSGARAVVAETPDHLARIAEVRGGLPELHARLVDRRQRRRRAEPARRRHRRRRRSRSGVRRAGPGDLATLIYTSGTTGRPKGCMLTHGNFMVELAVRHRRAATSSSTDDASTLLFLPLAHVFARDHPGRLRQARGARMGHSADIPHLLPDLQSFRPTFVLAVPAGVREDLQHRLAARDGRRPRPDLRPGRRGRHRLVARPGPGQALAGGPRPARGVPPPGLRQAARRARRPLRVRHLRRRAARRAARPLLPRHRAHRARGLRPDRDHRRADRQPPRRASRSARVGRPLPGTDACASPTTASCCSAADRSSPATGATTRRPPRRSTPTAGSTPATSARSTTRASSGSPAARRRSSSPPAARTSPRPCSRTGSGPTRWSPSAWWSATAARSSPRWSPSTPSGFAGWAEQPRQVRRRSPTSSTTRTCGPRSTTAVDEANKAVSKAESIRKFAILPDDWTEEAGQLTPSLKLKRNVVMREFQDDVAALYLP